MRKHGEITETIRNQTAIRVSLMALYMADLSSPGVDGDQWLGEGHLDGVGQAGRVVDELPGHLGVLPIIYPLESLLKKNKIQKKTLHQIC